MRNRNRVHPTGRFIAAVFGGLVLTCAFSSTADAQPQASDTVAKKPPTAKERDAARKHYDAGRTKFDAKDFSGALVEFQAANDTIPSPQAQEKIALCYDGMKDVAKAIQAYELFLQQSEGNAKLQESRTQAQQRIEALKKEPVSVVVTTEPTTTQVSIDGTTQSANSPLRLELAPGKHTIEVSALGYEASVQELEIQPGDTPKNIVFSLTKSLEPTAQVVAPPATQPVAPLQQDQQPAPAAKKRSNVPAYITLGVAGAGAIVGTVFGVKALKSKSSYNDNPNVSDADDAEKNAIVADMAFGVAITMGITGTVLLLTNRGTSEDKTETTAPATAQKPKLYVAPYVGRSAGGAAATLTF